MVGVTAAWVREGKMGGHEGGGGARRTLRSSSGEDGRVLRSTPKKRRVETPLHTVPHPSGNRDGAGRALHAMTETFVRRARACPVAWPRASLLPRPDVLLVELRPSPGGAVLGHVAYVREDSDAWGSCPAERDRLIDATVCRVQNRTTTDGSENSESPSAGVYVATGSSTRVRPVGVTCSAQPRGPQYLPEIGRWVPFRHANSQDSGVVAIVAAAAPILSAAASFARVHLPNVQRGLERPLQACGAIGEIFTLPSADMQTGRREDEFGPPRASAHRTGVTPTQHIAARVSGVPLHASSARLLDACHGLSNHHTDPIDASREHGVPIIYIPRVDPRVRPHPRPLRSSDLLLGENSAASGEGARLWRITTCVPGYVCIVYAHYESMLHANVYPDVGGHVRDNRGALHLERTLTPGVELLRLVAYSLRSLDTFADMFEREWRVRPQHGREALLRELWHKLDPPLSYRLLQLYPWLA